MNVGRFCMIYKNFHKYQYMIKNISHLLSSTNTNDESWIIDIWYVDSSFDKSTIYLN